MSAEPLNPSRLTLLAPPTPLEAVRAAQWARHNTRDGAPDARVAGSSDPLRVIAAHLHRIEREFETRCAEFEGVGEGDAAAQCDAARVEIRAMRLLTELLSLHCDPSNCASVSARSALAPAARLASRRVVP